MSELTERGLELFSEMRGAERAAEMRDAISCGGFGSAMMALAVDFVFGSIWTRPGLDRKQRSLVTLGILIALRRTEEFKNHVQIGLGNGLTVGEALQIPEESFTACGALVFTTHANEKFIAEHLT